MSITLTDGTVTVELDKDLLWSDEFSFRRIEKTATRSITGARIVHQGVKQGGRPITLQPEHDRSAWMTRAVVEQLQAWANSATVALTLTLRGVARSVEIESVEARAVQHFSDTDPDDHYVVTLRMTEV